MAFHDWGYVPFADYGTNAYVLIHRKGSQYDITVSTVSETLGYTSPNNPMQISRIDIGQEIQGTSTASAPEAYWNDNQWIDSGGSYHYQNRNGDFDVITKPPYTSTDGGWITTPSSSSTGGEWFALY